MERDINGYVYKTKVRYDEESCLFLIYVKEKYGRTYCKCTDFETKSKVIAKAIAIDTERKLNSGEQVIVYPSLRKFKRDNMVEFVKIRNVKK